MKLRFVIAVVGMALMAFGATDAFAAKSFKTTAKITEGGPTLFKGTVSSKEPACEKGRKVSLFYEQGKRAGEVVGTDKTNSKGKWEMPGSYYAGQYHIEVKAKSVKTKRDDGPTLGECLEFLGLPNPF